MFSVAKDSNLPLEIPVTYAGALVSDLTVTLPSSLLPGHRYSAQAYIVQHSGMPVASGKAVFATPSLGMLFSLSSFFCRPIMI